MAQPPHGYFDDPHGYESGMPDLSELEDFNPAMFENVGLTPEDLEQIWGSNAEMKSEYAKYQKMMQENAAMSFHQSLQGSYQHMNMNPAFPMFSPSLSTPGTPYSANGTLSPHSLQIFQSSQEQKSSEPSAEEVQAILNKSLYQPSQNLTQPSQQLLHDILAFQSEQKQNIEQIFQKQKELLANPQQEMYNMLLAEQRTAKDQLKAAVQSLNQLYSTVILEPPDLQRVYWLRHDLEIQMRQLDLLLQELAALAQPSGAPPCLATLVVLKQPFPFVINKNKQIAEDQLQIQLLTSANLRVQSISHAKANLLCDAPQGKGAPAKLIATELEDHESQPIDPSSRIAKFPLKFLAGTKKAPAQVKFSMQIQMMGTPVPVTIESPTTTPLVVITNECQWEDSAGTLLKKEAFSNGRLEIPWPEFGNTLQHHFLRATKQELSRPRRILSLFDLKYFHEKHFGGKSVISSKDFDEFWEWFGKCMHKIRYQRHIGSLWMCGLFYGFMCREDVESALQGQPPGSFLIRFSERHGGHFAIAYIGAERPHRIKHYLVQDHDTASAKKTLPDFLTECPQFSHLLALTNNEGRPTFLRCPKDPFMEQFCGKKTKTELDNGYEPL